MTTVNLSKTIDEYFSYRDLCGLKQCPKECVRKFYSFSCKAFPGEDTLIQAMIDTWWEKRDTERVDSYCIRVCQVLPYLKFVIARYPNAEYIVPDTPKWKLSKYVPHFYTKEELTKFFKECDNMGHHNNMLECLLNEIEFPVLFRLLLSTGMRTTEVRLLEKVNVDLAKGCIYIVREATKGYMERRVFLHESMRRLLVDYDAAVENLVPNRKVFFPNDHDQTHSDEWISIHFKRIWKKAVGTDGVIAYDLRHHFIIDRINSWTGRDYEVYPKMMALCKYVGHSDLESTYSYYAYAPQMGQIMDSASSAKMDRMIQSIPPPNEM